MASTLCKKQNRVLSFLVFVATHPCIKCTARPCLICSLQYYTRFSASACAGMVPRTYRRGAMSL